MVTRRLAVWVVLGLLLTSTPPVHAQEDARCGYAAEPESIVSAARGVPLLLRAPQLPGDERARMHRHRTRLLQREVGGGDDETCAATEAYLQGVLARLVRGSKLEAFAQREPALTLVFQCDATAPLPVARASAGKLVLVPRSLPLLAASEDAIAAVLAHELAHLTLRHAERFVRAWPTKRSDRERSGVKREHEREADVTGLLILANAGYDAYAAITHLEAVDALAKARTPRPNTRGVHDDARIRTAQLEAQIRACRYPRRKARPVAGLHERVPRAAAAHASPPAVELRE